MIDTSIKPQKQLAKEHIEYLQKLNKLYKTTSDDFLIKLKNGAKARCHLLNSSQFKLKNNSARNRHYSHILDLELLIATATYIGSTPNKKSAVKKAVKCYHYFLITKSINGIDYDIVLNAEELISNETGTPKVIYLYDITEYKAKNNPHRVQT